MDKSRPLLPAGQCAANRSDTVRLANNGQKDTRWPVVDKESTREGTARPTRDELSFERAMHRLKALSFRESHEGH